MRIAALKVNWDDEWPDENTLEENGDDANANGATKGVEHHKPHGTAKSGGKGKKRAHEQTEAGSTPAVRGSSRKQRRAV